jgi:hypothetical protein
MALRVWLQKRFLSGGFRVITASKANVGNHRRKKRGNYIESVAERKIIL